MKLLIHGARSAADIPDMGQLPGNIEIAYAPDGETLGRELPGSEILLAWSYEADDLKTHWDKCSDLKWINWCGAGVDAVLFDDLKNSEVMLSNARGIFDRAMSETVLAYMLFVAKDFEKTIAHQNKKIWEHRVTRQLFGDKALIVGVGSIGRDFARLLNANSLECYGAGRSARPGDDEFREIYDSAELTTVLHQFDWVTGILPSTPGTTGYFDRHFFSAMNENAHFINLGRGTAVVENDLIDALNNNSIAGAMLDVFCNEPLGESDPLWETKNLFISPHMTGDFVGYEKDMVIQFKYNLDKYISGQPLENVVDKQLGFVRSA